MYVIAWSRKDGRPLPPSAEDDGQGALVIHNVQHTDAGIYVCTASNEYAIAQDEAILEIQGTDFDGLGGILRSVTKFQFSTAEKISFINNSIERF